MRERAARGQAGGLEALRADADKLRAAVEFATACGAFTTTKPGAIGAQPSEQQVMPALVLLRNGLLQMEASQQWVLNTSALAGQGAAGDSNIRGLCCMMCQSLVLAQEAVACMTRLGGYAERAECKSACECARSSSVGSNKGFMAHAQALNATASAVIARSAPCQFAEQRLHVHENAEPLHQVRATSRLAIADHTKLCCAVPSKTLAAAMLSHVSG